MESPTAPARAASNYSVLVAELPGAGAGDNYEGLVADIWVGAVLTLMVLSCVCCVCSCLLYHKFQQWKQAVLRARGTTSDPGESAGGDVESLPSYTIVSGLPSYEEALAQLRRAREFRSSVKGGGPDPAPIAQSLSPRAPGPVKLSVAELLQLYKSYPPM